MPFAMCHWSAKACHTEHAHNRQIPGATNFFFFSFFQKKTSHFFFFFPGTSYKVQPARWIQTGLVVNVCWVTCMKGALGFHPAPRGAVPSTAEPPAPSGSAAGSAGRAGGAPRASARGGPWPGMAHSLVCCTHLRKVSFCGGVALSRRALECWWVIRLLLEKERLKKLRSLSGAGFSSRRAFLHK